ncbi:hypothetical protein CDAR_557781 [Caerostris darwini]|uniref:Uncharacterized protein n=1 Tax=Caerostris darwini TaxID=1538125 RepID=A0AAV4RH58_9ARAC|nr:hypothetical protein CDAR_557781 [Caerostris darwini]
MKGVFSHSSDGLHFNHLRCNLSHLVAQTPCRSFNIHKESAHSSGHVEQTPPFPEERLCAQAPSISLINSHLQPATGAFKSVRPCLHFHRLPQ